MMPGKLDWDPRPPNLRERMIAGVWLAASLPVFASYLAGWDWFDGHDKQVSAGLVLIGLLLFQALPGVKRADSPNHDD